MKVRALSVCVLLSVVMATPLWAGPEAETGPDQASTTGLPASLDALYPPRARQPVYLLSMVALATALDGVLADLEEGDGPGVASSFEALQARYSETAELVPEWKTAFPAAPIEELSAALEAGEPGKIRPAVGALGAVCTGCHVAHMTRVQHRYHWPSYGDVEVTDPLSEESVGFLGLMRMIGVSFSGITVDLGQGQLDGSRQHLQGFKARFAAMKEACMSCHDSERSYYVDARVEDLISELEEALAAPEVDASAVGGLVGGIAQQSCLGCHRVHMPAALARHR